MVFLSQSRWLGLAVMSASVVKVGAFVTCYYPDGSIPTDYDWQPCTSGGHSSCCIPSEGDICQENGFCYYPPNGNLFRGACTDPTFQDPSCPKQCTSGNYHFTWAWIQACKGGTFECGGLADAGHQLATCAVADSGFGVQTVSRSSISTVIAIPTGPTSSEAATSTSPSANADTTSTSSSSSSQTSPASGIGSGSKSGTTQQSSSSPALSTGAIAGIAVGGAVGFIIIAILVFLLMRKRRTPHNTSGTAYAPAPQAPPSPSPMQQYAQPPMSTLPVGGYYSADTVKVPPGSPPPVYPQTFVSPDQGKLSPQSNAAELSAPIQAPVQQSPVGSYRVPEQQSYVPYRAPEQAQQQQIYSPVSSMAPSPNPQGVHQVGGFTAELDGTQVWEK